MLETVETNNEFTDETCVTNWSLHRHELVNRSRLIILVFFHVFASNRDNDEDGKDRAWKRRRS